MARELEILEIQDEQHEEMRELNSKPDHASITWRQQGSPEYVRTGNVAVRTHDRIIEMEPGMVESWLMAMKVVANGLLWTCVLLATGLLLTWLVYLVHWRAGSF